jgi:hypothetical protein
MGMFFRNLDREAYDREYSDLELTRRIFKYFKPHRKAMVLVGGVTVISSAMGMSRGLSCF